MLSKAGHFEENMVEMIGNEVDLFFTNTWKRVQMELKADKSITTLVDKTIGGFTDCSQEGYPKPYSMLLGVQAAAVSYKDQIIIPHTLRLLSPAYFLQSNGNAELAVEMTKCLLESNISLHGNLDANKVPT